MFTGLSLLNVFLFFIGVYFDLHQAILDKKFHARYFWLRLVRIVFLLVGVFAMYHVKPMCNIPEQFIVFQASITLILIALNMRGLYDYITRC